MRAALLVFALGATGCATTVFRLEGEPQTPGGTAQNACESKEWLVIAPTRADVVDDKSGKSHPEKGLGLYRVGSNHPESIPALEKLPESDMVTRKRDEVSPYHTKQYVAGALGVVGVIGLAVGTALFVSSFETSQSRDAMTGALKEESSVNGGRLAASGVTVGLGFAFGIAGLLVNPSHADRTKANASRFVFLDPPDSSRKVNDLVERHNEEVRDTCGGGGAAAASAE